MQESVNLFVSVARDGVCVSFGEFKFVEDTLKIFCDPKVFKECPVEFLPKTFFRGNAVQTFSNFPAKRLSIYRKKILSHLFIS